MNTMNAGRYGSFEDVLDGGFDRRQPSSPAHRRSPHDMSELVVPRSPSLCSSTAPRAHVPGTRVRLAIQYFRYTIGITGQTAGGGKAWGRNTVGDNDIGQCRRGQGIKETAQESTNTGICKIGRVTRRAYHHHIHVHSSALPRKLLQRSRLEQSLLLIRRKHLQLIHRDLAERLFIGRVQKDLGYDLVALWVALMRIERFSPSEHRC